MPLPERPVLRAPRRRVRLPRIAHRPGRVRGWLVRRGTEIRLTGMCACGIAAAYVQWGVPAGLTAGCVSFGFLEWMAGDDNGGQP